MLEEGKGIEINLFRECDNPTFKQIIQHYRLRLFSQINEIVFYGKGGYDFNTVYEMPIWLRNFIYHKMEEAYRKEAEAAKGAANTETQQVKKNSPNIRVPDYSAKRPARQ